ncbi:Ulp1 family isopeptidase, partial [Bradyrhizobium jicamae]|uniref:Ulp1 family isopeptidase n=1 Tax=Bradyrhizobium jicamae TaxID=280332 RepID=UPI000A79370C
VDLPSTPQQMRDDAQSAPVGGAAARPPFFSAQSGGATPSSRIYSGLQSLTDLPSFTPQELRDDAQSASGLSSAGQPPFFIGTSGVPQEIEEIGYLVGQDWQHRSQPVPDFLLDVLDNRMLLPSSAMVPQSVSINGETYSIALGTRGRREAYFIHHARPSTDPQIGASLSGSSSGDRSGRVLDFTEWLSDEHIQRDYELLAQELLRSNPDLAARTRFVDPLIAFRMNHAPVGEAMTELRRIVCDRSGNDRGIDFLFLPVNDARPTGEGGAHWSLLLVDRRDRARPIAYHYDSLQGHNHGAAAHLAMRLDARLQQASISQQMNSYDCGVFLVDGTRALVTRLAAGWSDLNLNDLVADRRALQSRLRGHVGFN